MYLSLEKHVANGKLTVSDGRELEQLHFILRDFAVLLQVSGSCFPPTVPESDTKFRRVKGYHR